MVQVDFWWKGPTPPCEKAFKIHCTQVNRVIWKILFTCESFRLSTSGNLAPSLRSDVIRFSSRLACGRLQWKQHSMIFAMPNQPGPLPISYEQAFESKRSGSEVYYTACSLLVILKNSCSKLHCQKVSIWFPFHIRLKREQPSWFEGLTWKPRLESGLESLYVPYLLDSGSSFEGSSVYGLEGSGRWV